MVSVLIVGATRGLGASLTKQYASQSANTVFGTARSASTPADSPKGVTWLHNVDLTKSDVGEKLVDQFESRKPLDFVVRTKPSNFSRFRTFSVLTTQVHHRRSLHH